MRVTERIGLVASGAYGFGLTHPADCHVWVLDGGSEVALLDAGCGLEVGPLLRRLDGLGVQRDRVRRLFITHAHADHAGGAAALREALGVGVAASSQVADILRRGDERAASVHIGKAQGTYPADYAYAATEVDLELADGERVRVGDLEVEALVTPGHSVGHVCYLVRDGSRTDLFTGDTLLFGGRIVLQNIWDCDLRLHLDSLHRLGEYRFEGLFPGHLTFSVSDGERHLRVALEAIDRGAIPPTLL
jgi:glyoxylase-like metal-dependent hydrolase (beta-lactamase superfamily II)